MLIVRIIRLARVSLWSHQSAEESGRWEDKDPRTNNILCTRTGKIEQVEPLKEGILETGIELPFGTQEVACTLK